MFLTCVFTDLSSCTNHTVVAADGKVWSDGFPGPWRTDVAAHRQWNLKERGHRSNCTNELHAHTDRDPEFGQHVTKTNFCVLQSFLSQL